ncbi:ATP-dependent Clp protease adaptor protein ClpS, putative [Plasmodium sp. gorilla clade G3]|nr:ATP-dependent Clp protease adaptor protein ClpS, putative [Plasmodium sp. gorilla clade G3]
MFKYLKPFFLCIILLLLLIYKCTHSYNIKNKNSPLNFMNSRVRINNVDKNKNISFPRELQKRPSLVYTQKNFNLEKIKKLRNVIKEIKKDNIKEVDEHEKKEREKETSAWKVILYNDDIHNFTYVTDVIVKVVGQISKAKAHTITVEAHSTGQALILSTWKSKAEKYCQELQQNGLTVSIIHESQLKDKQKK